MRKIVGKFIAYEKTADGSLAVFVLRRGKKRLKSLQVPSHIDGVAVSTIRSCGFAGCSNLVEVDLPSTLTVIGGGAFEKCESLAKLTLPDSVEYVGNFAFFHCDSLSDVVIGRGVAHIGQYAFNCCAALQTVHFMGDDDWSLKSDWAGCEVKKSAEQLADKRHAAKTLGTTLSGYVWKTVERQSLFSD